MSYEAHIASVGLTFLLCIQAPKPTTGCHVIVSIYQANPRNTISSNNYVTHYSVLSYSHSHSYLSYSLYVPFSSNSRSVNLLSLRTLGRKSLEVRRASYWAV